MAQGSNPGDKKQQLKIYQKKTKGRFKKDQPNT